MYIKSTKFNRLKNKNYSNENVALNSEYKTKTYLEMNKRNDDDKETLPVYINTKHIIMIKEFSFTTESQGSNTFYGFDFILSNGEICSYEYYGRSDGGKLLRLILKNLLDKLASDYTNKHNFVIDLDEICNKSIKEYDENNRQ